MAYQVVIVQSALKDYNKLTPQVRSYAKQAMLKYLKNEPKKTTKTRIKKLVGLRKPQYRLRVGDVRIFYDVNEKEKRVEVLGFVPKSLAKRWLRQKGVQK